MNKRFNFQQRSNITVLWLREITRGLVEEALIRQLLDLRGSFPHCHSYTNPCVNRRARLRKDLFFFFPSAYLGFSVLIRVVQNLEEVPRQEMTIKDIITAFIAAIKYPQWGVFHSHTERQHGHETMSCAGVSWSEYCVHCVHMQSIPLSTSMCTWLTRCTHIHTSPPPADWGVPLFLYVYTLTYATLPYRSHTC